MSAGDGVSSILTGDGVFSTLTGAGVSSTVYGASVVVVSGEVEGVEEVVEGVGVESSSASRFSGWEGRGGAFKANGPATLIDPGIAISTLFWT